MVIIGMEDFNMFLSSVSHQNVESLVYLEFSQESIFSESIYFTGDNIFLRKIFKLKAIRDSRDGWRMPSEALQKDLFYSFYLPLIF